MADEPWGEAESRVGGLVRKGVMSYQRREEEGYWRVAQGRLKKVEGGGGYTRGVDRGFSYRRHGRIVANNPGTGAGGGRTLVVRWLVGSLTALHLNLERVEAFFGDKRRFPGNGNLKYITRVGVPVDVRPGGNLSKELSHGNHLSPETFDKSVWEKAVVNCGRW